MKRILMRVPNVFRYCGEYFDKETGTIYLRARYYDPQVGRFITEDSYWGKSSDPLSLNLYTYCMNNPIIFVDPSGRTPAKLKDLVNDAGGAVTWNPNTRTAVVVINGKTHSYTEGEFGNHIDGNRMYVELELFNRDFGLSKTSNEVTSLDFFAEKAGVKKGIGYSVYSGRTVNSYDLNGYGKYITARSYIVYNFANTVEGEKIAQAINSQMNTNVNSFETFAGTLGLGVGGKLGTILSVAEVADSIYGDNFRDCSYGLSSGDTLIITDYCASYIGSMSRVGVTTTITVYDKSGKLKFSGGITRN